MDPNATGSIKSLRHLLGGNNSLLVLFRERARDRGLSASSVSELCGHFSSAVEAYLLLGLSREEVRRAESARLRALTRGYAKEEIAGILETNLRIFEDKLEWLEKSRRERIGLPVSPQGEK
jgi:hypothetical protein